MQDNDEEREDSGGRDGRKNKDNYATIAADALNDESEARSNITIVVPTKTEDGGSTIQEQEQAGIDQGQGQETTSSTSDAFSTYSDDDTRMLTLLGLDPNSNPNEDEQVDWRQLTGFRGLRRRNNEDEAGNGTTPRRTRLSYELHPDVFWNMLLEDLNLNDNGNAGHGHGHGQPLRQQGQDHDEQHQAE